MEYNRFQCKGNYKLWVKVIRLISSQFTDADGSFKSLQKPGKPWKIQFVKFCNRVVHSLPWEHNILEKSWSKLELLERQLSYTRKTIQPYFSSRQYNTSNNNNKVTRDVTLWNLSSRSETSNKDYFGHFVIHNSINSTFSR